jgi:hypothetical protein
MSAPTHKTRWLETTCGCCRGYGMVSDYRGGDFNGAMGCDGCGEQGFYFVSENDRLAMWPGGPFLGMDPGAFRRLDGASA